MLQIRSAIFLLVIATALIACAPAPTPTAAPTRAPTAVATAASVPPTATPAPPVKLRVPYTAISVAMLPTWVAYEQGLFTKNGLEVTMDYLATSPLLTAAMLSGEVQIAEAAEEVVITSGLEGSDLVILASGGERLLFSLYTKTDIAKVEDLKGKKIGVTRRGASTDFAARYLLTKFNLKPDQDVALVAIGGVPEILAALQGGAVEGGVVSPPTTIKAKQAGFKELVDISALDLPFYQAPVVARKSWVRDNPETLRKFMKAYVEAIAVIKKDKNVTKKAIGKYTQTTDDAVLEESYNAFVKILPQAPYPRLDAIKVGMDQVALTNPKAKDADPNQFFDARWVEELDKSGYIASLYK